MSHTPLFYFLLLSKLNDGIICNLNKFFSCIWSILFFNCTSSITPVLIYLSRTSYVNPKLSSSVLSQRPSEGIFSINSFGSPSAYPTSLTSATVRLDNGLKSPTLSPHHVLYPIQSSDKLHVFATLPFTI